MQHDETRTKKRGINTLPKLMDVLAIAQRIVCMELPNSQHMQTTTEGFHVWYWNDVLKTLLLTNRFGATIEQT